MRARAGGRSSALRRAASTGCDCEGGRKVARSFARLAERYPSTRTQGLRREEASEAMPRRERKNIRADIIASEGASSTQVADAFVEPASAPRLDPVHAAVDM